MMVLHGSGVLPGSAAATAVPPLTLRNSDTHWRRRFAAPAAPQMISAANAHSASTPLTLRLFGNVSTTGARCLDGSSSGYYYRRGSEATSIVIFLEGGGLCVEPIDCLQRAKTNLGSSLKWSTTWTDTSNVLSSNATFNTFANWTHVYVPYCSGDVYIGQQTHKNALGLYFAGHNTLRALVRSLTPELGTATRVLLSGASAGGIGVFQNADWLGTQLRAVRSANAPALDYRAAPQAGSYFVNDVVVEMAQFITLPLLDALNMAGFAASYLYEFFGGLGDEKPYLDATCVAARQEKPHQCWSSVVHYPHISTPLFVAQNMYDQNQCGDIFGAEWWPLPLNKSKHAAAKTKFIRYFGNQTRNGIAAAVVAGKPSDALWMPSCYQHTGNLCMRGGSVVQGDRFRDAITTWWKGDSEKRTWIDTTCGLTDPCNAFCGC